MDNKAQVFEFLYKRSNESYNINQISRILDISVGSAFKILKYLERHDYAKAAKRNNAILYQICTDSKTTAMHNKIDEHRKIGHSVNKTKIACTIGDSVTYSILNKLVENGMNALIVKSHNEKSAIEKIKMIKEVSTDIPILLEIQKPYGYWTKFALKQDLDFIVLPSISNAGDIKQIYRYLGYNDIKQVIGEKIKLLVRVGKESLKNYREIIENAYGIVIDENYLAQSTKIERLPDLYKDLISECNRNGKPVLIMGIMESMVNNSQPLKSEVFNLINAVQQGISCLVLSNETENGKYPVESLRIASLIIRSVEAGRNAHSSENNAVDFTNAIAKAISEVNKVLNIDAIIIITSGGFSARMISSRRLSIRVIAATSKKKIYRQLNLLWGIQPLLINANLEDISNNEKKTVILEVLRKGLIKRGDQIAIIASVFHGNSKRTNLLEIHNVNEFLEYLNSSIVEAN